MKLFKLLIICFPLLSLAQSFGEIQKQTSVAEYFFSRGPKKLITTTIDTDYVHEFKAIDLIRIIGPTSYWAKSNKFTFDLSEVAFVNWNAGGSNSISGLFGTHFKRLFVRNALKWNNELRMRYGVNQQEGQELRKTDDDLEFISTFGYRVSEKSNWYYSGKFSFNSQFSRGYNYPNRDVSISDFMAPGYLFLGVGSEYTTEDKNNQIYLSPVTMKSTFVLNQRLANQGAFGVEKAILDDDGNIIKNGKSSRMEIGILVTNEYKREIFQNVNMNSHLRLYTDYLNKFGNIDIDWELNFDFKVNGFIKASFGSHLRYDDDVRISNENENGEVVEGGPKVQWKQQLGIGVIVEL
ncbi:DUF3078 domain-containing protein [Psychroflexus sp. ALD_RP9]|uniref:DUF3078 domain-containing protein n=1 Tax=Psychroflexus sp. ALD_RP9 TaxID=2777186 RepID=UPI001A8CF943|nr:DUF3078 domain-containing protein [Psychroflexus sp. ALD_RP9]QSS97340.1 DUF3078 domain-containing protein [Psychroflexus sp. ALD_RP9]